MSLSVEEKGRLCTMMTFLHRQPSLKEIRLDGSTAFCPLLLRHGWYLRTCSCLSRTYFIEVTNFCRSTFCKNFPLKSLQALC